MLERLTNEIQALGYTGTQEAYPCLYPDGWGGRGVTLVKSEWDKAEFRLDTRGTPMDQTAVNITITGRTVQQQPGTAYFATGIRVRIEWILDDPHGNVSATHGGWLATRRI